MNARPNWAYSNFYEFKECIRNGEIVFFAGAGIGVDSGLVQVGDVFQTTFDAHFPSVDPMRRSIAESMQPEQFYSTLIEATGSESCLFAWRSLSPVVWDSKEYRHCKYRPMPNFVHLFIVAYSYAARVPIFTVNYDLMFEEACRKLGIDDYRVISNEPTARDLRESGLVICKLHGTIPSDGSAVSAHDIRTTMESISQKSKKWLDFSFHLLNGGKRICFVGYSGRDIDYCPFYIDYYTSKNGASKPFWTMSAGSAQDDDSPPKCFADKMGACVLPKYPSALLPDCKEAAFGLMDDSERVLFDLAASKQHGPAPKRAMADLLQELAKAIVPTSSEIEDLFWASAFSKIGLVDECSSHLENCKKHYGANFEKMGSDRAIKMMIEFEMSMKRERADFVGYRRAARRLGAWARQHAEGDEAEIASLRAQFEVASSYYMSVPHNLSYDVPLVRRKYGMFAISRIWEGVLNRRFKCALESGNERIRYLSQECRIRTLAADLAILDYFGNATKWRDAITGKFVALREDALSVGNYVTAIGVSKYLYRLLGKEEFAELVNSQGELVGLVSFLSTTLADQGDYNGAIEAARKNGNTLNLIKGYFKKAKAIQYDRGSAAMPRIGKAALTDEELCELDAAIAIVTPKSLRRTLQRMRAKCAGE